ncbi:competence protein CoiA family protein [Okeania sp. KiyG1]|uniref:competence protein CoiA family protein n=1 Tax=Okeania sp. KiyG1 TaxID=2720165 RepID=UPI00192302D7|nr:competence protein CoiA family protein [Okeania sp. KiyG1]GFZ93336.1 hypothetical protein CYANOKiyG1_04160 [Okeania sp. KiyG1]
MALSCILKSTGKYLDAKNYDPQKHRNDTWDKFVDSPVFYRKDHWRTGTYVRPHFVSQYKGNFPDTKLIFDPEYFKNNQTYSPRESWEHIEGKFYVAEYCLKCASDGLKPDCIQFEHLVKMPSGKYRIIDVAIVMAYGDIFAHEIQLASITPEQLEARSEDYRNIGIDVVWWLGKSANTQANREWHGDYFSRLPPVLLFTETDNASNTEGEARDDDKNNYFISNIDTITDNDEDDYF